LRLLARSALAATAGVAAGLAFEPYHWWFLLPIAVAALTLLAMAAPGLRSGFWVGFVFGTAFMLVLLPWLQVIGVYAWIPLAVLEGLFYGLAGLAARIVVRLTRIIFDRSRSGGRRSSSKRPARMASRIASRTCSGRGAFSSSTSTVPYSSPTAARMSAGSLRVA